MCHVSDGGARQLPKNCQERMGRSPVTQILRHDVARPLVWLFKLPGRGPKKDQSFLARGQSRPCLYSEYGVETMLNNIGLPGLLLIAVVVLVLFGRGKISSLMGEVGKGITSFKKGISEGEDDVKNGDKDTAELGDDTIVVTETKTDKDRV